MPTRIPLLARALGAAAIALVVAACSVAGTTGSPDATQTPGTGGTASASPAPSSPGTGSGSTPGFYLRAWTGRAADPKATFSWPTMLTIANGTVYDGRVAVPAIYPGPLLVTPYARSISGHGIETIVAEARKLGLLGTKTDFTTSDPAGASNATAGAASGGPATSGAAPSAAVGAASGAAMPGIDGGAPAILASGQLTIVVDGVRHDLTGDVTPPASCPCGGDPGTAEAFATFWRQLEDLQRWLGSDLGAAKPMTVERLTVLTLTPQQPAAPIEPSETAWPISTAFAAFGARYGSGSDRCAVVSGADLAKLLPVVEKSNSLTRFVDSTGAKRSLLVRVLTPGETSPCGG